MGGSGFLHVIRQLALGIRFQNPVSIPNRPAFEIARSKAALLRVVPSRRSRRLPPCAAWEWAISKTSNPATSSLQTRTSRMNPKTEVRSPKGRGRRQEDRAQRTAPGKLGTAARRFAVRNSQGGRSELGPAPPTPGPGTADPLGCHWCAASRRPAAAQADRQPERHGFNRQGDFHGSPPSLCPCPFTFRAVQLQRPIIFAADDPPGGSQGGTEFVLEG